MIVFLFFDNIYLHIVKQNIEDYSVGVNVEVFGSNDLGLIYFETKIIKRENDVFNYFKI